MEAGQGPNWGCSAKGKKSFNILENNLFETTHTFVLAHKIAGNSFSTHLHVMPAIPWLHFCNVLRRFISSPFQQRGFDLGNRTTSDGDK
jgi:hypothetical protein